MHIDPGVARNLTDDELIRALEQSRNSLTDTPAEEELLRRFALFSPYRDAIETAAEHKLDAEDIEALANARHGDTQRTVALLETLGEYGFTEPVKLGHMLEAVCALYQAQYK